MEKKFSLKTVIYIWRKASRTNQLCKWLQKIKDADAKSVDSFRL